MHWLYLALGGLLLMPISGGRIWADTFREIGVVPPHRAHSIVSPGGDPDIDLPTEDIHPHPAVVRIIVPERSSTSYGSGTLVDVQGEHGLVLTNWHVVSDAVRPPTVLFADGFRSLAHVVKADRDWDLAALAIWRPQVEPVRLAAEPPRPGEMLSIAGYGQGPYRLASGRCTNYLAPNTRLPREMVELAAAARQGDSGGPIFNRQGELAGVLWGEGNGYTTGSYCGRVRQFLAGVVPEEPASDDTMVPVPPRAVARQLAAAALASTATAARPSSSTNYDVPQASATGTVLASRPDLAPGTSAAGGFEPSQATDCPSFDWLTFVGRTRPEQGKTLLAVIGVAAIALRVRRSFAAA